MRVFGITTVRNAASTIRISVLLHLALGIERILVLDNGSTDATPYILRRLARHHPVSVTRDDGPFRHDELMTGLLHEAASLGADWVVPFDHDEFLASDEPLGARLGYVQSDGILIRVLNFVQRRGRRSDSPRALLTMVMRPERPVEATRAAALAATGRMAVVEAEWPRKLILRASSHVRLEIGSHGAHGIGPLELADWCRFLHAPFRARRMLVRAAEHGRRVRGERPPDVGWQKQLLAAAGDAGGLREQWRLNSWGRERTIGPDASPLIGDTALMEAVRPWVRSPGRQLAARVAGRPF